MQTTRFFTSKRHALTVGVTALLAGATLTAAVVWSHGPSPRPRRVVLADPVPSPGDIIESLFPTPSPTMSPSPEPTEPTDQPSPSASPKPFEHGQEADGYSELKPDAMSADGRYVVFSSYASNLAPNDGHSDPHPFIDDPYCDTPCGQDIFLRDVEQGTNTLVSVSSKEVRGNANSFHGAISGDGRYIAFASDASNLVPGDTNRKSDVFVRDRIEGTTVRVSVDSAGAQASAESGWPSLSGDGRYVVFASEASDLVSDDTNGMGDVFVHDQQTRKTIRVSVSSSGAQGDSVSLASAISADGTVVAFVSDASNFFANDDNPDPDRDGWSMDLFVHDLAGRRTTHIASTPLLDAPTTASLSANGRYVAFTSRSPDLVPNDTNGVEDAFVYDRKLTKLTRVSESSSGGQADRASMNSAISADGRYVTFGSNAGNLVDRDSNGCANPDNTTWWCGADVFLHDTATGTTTLLSRSSSERQGNGDSGIPSISADGRYVVFQSRADNLVEPDTNRCKVFEERQPCSDIFLRDTRSGITTRLSDS